MLRYAKAIAAQFDAELILLHVANPIYEVPPTGLSGPLFIPVPQKTIAKQGEELEQFGVDELQGIKVRRVLYEGNPEEQIAGFAKSEEIGLIAMPTHGHGIFRQFLIGSVTAKVLHDVDCPVLTGLHMEDQLKAGPARFSKFLCAIDSSPQSSGILKWASELAAGFHAQLDIVHAEGETAGAVCSSAREAGADLLVIGRGLQDAAGAGMTAQAYAIVRQSPCPVISIVSTSSPAD
jgi:nucleotide-binding universal stress UspA family protein